MAELGAASSTFTMTYPSLRFLVETGAEISALPLSLVDRQNKRPGSSPQAATGSSVATYELSSPTRDLGLPRSFR